MKNTETFDMNFEVNNDNFDLALCEMFANFDRLGDKLWKDHEIDTGDFSTFESLRIARDLAREIVNQYETQLAECGDADFTEILYMGGDQLFIDRIVKEWDHRNEDRQPERKTFPVPVHANAFLTLQIEAASEEEAREKAQGMIDAGGFVTDHYTEFEIDSDAEIM